MWFVFDDAELTRKVNNGRSTLADEGSKWLPRLVVVSARPGWHRVSPTPGHRSFFRGIAGGGYSGNPISAPDLRIADENFGGTRARRSGRIDRRKQSGARSRLDRK